jgi:GT2 family glycosyltransferase
MRASVIVVSYNSRADLEPCIESILRELGSQDELIVVDNGSTDGSADLVAERFAQARLIRGANTGYAGGNNRGAAAATGEFLVFLNPDTELWPGALDALLAPLEQANTAGQQPISDDRRPTTTATDYGNGLNGLRNSQGDIALTTACVVHKGQPEVINTCGNTMHYTGLTYCRGGGRPRSEYTASAEVDAVSGAAFAMRRALFIELGGFDERFFMYVEDTDLSWRARLAGYRCLYVAEAVVAHDYRPSYSPAKAFYLDRNRHLLLLKNVRGATYLRMLPGLLLGEIVTGGFLLLKGPRYWGVKPRVYRWLWKHRRAVRAARHSAQPHRRAADRELLGRLTYRLDFRQLAGRTISRLAALAFHPAFWAARLLFRGDHA